jgi:hypothetical protein
MNKINTAQGEWTVIQARYNTRDSSFGEVVAWARATFGPADTVPRWIYLSGNNFGFLFEEDAVIFALRWA